MTREEQAKWYEAFQVKIREEVKFQWNLSSVSPKIPTPVWRDKDLEPTCSMECPFHNQESRLGATCERTYTATVDGSVCGAFTKALVNILAQREGELKVLYKEIKR